MVEQNFNFQALIRCGQMYSAKRWQLRCVILHPGSSGRRGEFKQPSLHILAEYRVLESIKDNAAQE